MSHEMYFSCDVEADGPVPGLNSMLSIGVSALDPKTQEECGSFYQVLEPLPTASRDPDTMKWWAGFPEQYAMATKDPVDPEIVMWALDSWVRKMLSEQQGAAETPPTPIFVAYPCSFDFMFYAHYAHRFVKRSVFGFVALDMASVAMGFNGGAYDDQVKKKWPPTWVEPKDRVAIHHALEDARQQADIFRRMMWSVRMPEGSRVRAPTGEVGVLGPREPTNRVLYTRSPACGHYYGSYPEFMLTRVAEDEPLTIDTDPHRPTWVRERGW